MLGLSLTVAQGVFILTDPVRGPGRINRANTPGNAAAAYLEADFGIGQNQHTLGPAYKIIFFKHTASPSLLSDLWMEKLLPGNEGLSARCAPRTV